MQYCAFETKHEIFSPIFFSPVPLKMNLFTDQNMQTPFSVSSCVKFRGCLKLSYSRGFIIRANFIVALRSRVPADTRHYHTYAMLYYAQICYHSGPGCSKGG